MIYIANTTKLKVHNKSNARWWTTFSDHVSCHIWRWGLQMKPAIRKSPTEPYNHSSSVSWLGVLCFGTGTSNCLLLFVLIMAK